MYSSKQMNEDGGYFWTSLNSKCEGLTWGREANISNNENNSNEAHFFLHVQFL